MSKNKNLIISKWIFKMKYKQNGIIKRFKIWLIMRNFIQKYGIDYEKTFVPILQYKNLRMFIFIIIQFEFVLHQMNVDNAYFLNNLLKEIYLKIPKKLISKSPDEVLLLQKDLYGLKQSNRVWNQKLFKFLAFMGFQFIFFEFCVFVNAKKHLIIIFYINNC